MESDTSWFARADSRKKYNTTTHPDVGSLPLGSAVATAETFPVGTIEPPRVFFLGLEQRRGRHGGYPPEMDHAV